MMEWFGQSHSIIPFDPLSTSPSNRPPSEINWYKEHWQREIQILALQHIFQSGCLPPLLP
ncbi:hypothetical protein FRC03_011727 [Tulasnella sp. 419]|nr:hypothetical protein FRC03_011727 [Tulasnella sp. 419]